ncbi:MAG: hypothetical protein M1820_005543 [Bogoriella megaspora]|nr:MAG: hypothetical protein M1820_005543 [Bogoriella megaspora]
MAQSVPGIEVGSTMPFAPFLRSLGIDTIKARLSSSKTQSRSPSSFTEFQVFLEQRARYYETEQSRATYRGKAEICCQRLKAFCDVIEVISADPGDHVLAWQATHVALDQYTKFQSVESARQAFNATYLLIEALPGFELLQDSTVESNKALWINLKGNLIFVLRDFIENCLYLAKHRLGIALPRRPEEGTARFLRALALAFEDRDKRDHRWRVELGANHDHCFCVPRFRNHNVQGQEQELEELSSILRPDHQTVNYKGEVKVLLQSPVEDGGKFDLALEYAYRYESRYDYIFWLSARDSLALGQSSSPIVRQLVPPNASAGDDSDALGTLTQFSLLSGKISLIILGEVSDDWRPDALFQSRLLSPYVSIIGIDQSGLWRLRVDADTKGVPVLAMMRVAKFTEEVDRSTRSSGSGTHIHIHNNTRNSDMHEKSNDTSLPSDCVESVVAEQFNEKLTQLEPTRYTSPANFSAKRVVNETTKTAVSAASNTITQEQYRLALGTGAAGCVLGGASLAVGGYNAYNQTRSRKAAETSANSSTEAARASVRSADAASQAVHEARRNATASERSAAAAERNAETSAADLEFRRESERTKVAVAPKDIISKSIRQLPNRQNSSNIARKGARQMHEPNELIRAEPADQPGPSKLGPNTARFEAGLAREKQLDTNLRRLHGKYLSSQQPRSLLSSSRDQRIDRERRLSDQQDANQEERNTSLRDDTAILENPRDRSFVKSDNRLEDLNYTSSDDSGDAYTPDADTNGLNVDWSSGAPSYSSNGSAVNTPVSIVEHVKAPEEPGSTKYGEGRGLDGVVTDYQTNASLYETSGRDGDSGKVNDVDSALNHKDTGSASCDASSDDGRTWRSKDKTIFDKYDNSGSAEASDRPNDTQKNVMNYGANDASSSEADSGESIKDQDNSTCLSIQDNTIPMTRLDPRDIGERGKGPRK